MWRPGAGNGNPDDSSSTYKALGRPLNESGLLHEALLAWNCGWLVFKWFYCDFVLWFIWWLLSWWQKRRYIHFETNQWILGQDSSTQHPSGQFFSMFQHNSESAACVQERGGGEILTSPETSTNGPLSFFPHSVEISRKKGPPWCVDSCPSLMFPNLFCTHTHVGSCLLAQVHLAQHCPDW